MNSFSAQRFPYLSSREEADGRPITSKGIEASDEHLLSRLCNGDLEALGLLFGRYANPVRSIGRRILRDDAEADDLVQDLFTFIQRKSSIFDSSRCSAGSWIVHMAYQRAIEQRRRLVSRQFYNREDLDGAANHLVGKPTTEDDYSPEVVFGRNGLEKVVGELSPDQRETMRLYFFEGHTLAEISAKMAQSPGNVRNHYYRGLDKLRKHMFGRKVRGG
ncbi:MAG: sigma-70 family RNA polymerase sigma factor [Candidatus Acidiferrales bacterium]